MSSQIAEREDATLCADIRNKVGKCFFIFCKVFYCLAKLFPKSGNVPNELKWTICQVARFKVQFAALGPFGVY